MFIFCSTYRTADLEMSKVARAECRDCSRNVLEIKPTGDYPIFAEAPWFVQGKCPERITQNESTKNAAQGGE